MTLVIAVLVLSLVASVPACVFGLMLMKGEGAELKKMTELYESGVEVQAQLVSLVPFGNRGYAHAHYEFPSPQGPARHEKGAEVGPAHVVGERYPMVFDPQNTKRVHLGTKASVRRERARRVGYVRNAKRMAVLSFAAGTLATVGLVLTA
ncbi:DUF3592 domain-containing protein [Streptomyces sp. NPDC050400]|uniref:DUF3592 domain-containing protein n=1 Tax=Streptomyces sp. NPDC050400 TaxID=3365610 RepID=UPI0037A22EA9